MNILAIILTYNEEMHLDRCISSLKKISADILIVDSYSTDATLEIAKKNSVRVIQNKWTNHAIQFNWALTKIEDKTQWIIRVDADEVLSPVLISEINEYFSSEKESAVNGIYCNRRIAFQGRLIRYGGIFPIKVMRIFRYEYGKCENRWMDEHIVVLGKTIEFNGEILDNNLRSLSWWTDKHNGYASREAVDLLNLEFKFIRNDLLEEESGLHHKSLKRWLKESIYLKLPGGLRAAVYFIYRYIIQCKI